MNMNRQKLALVAMSIAKDKLQVGTKQVNNKISTN